MALFVMIFPLIYSVPHLVLYQMDTNHFIPVLLIICSWIQVIDIFYMFVKEHQLSELKKTRTIKDSAMYYLKFRFWFEVIVSSPFFMILLRPHDIAEINRKNMDEYLVPGLIKPNG